MKRKLKTYTISAVAEQYSLHPQTLRMYEREGLLKPSRSEGNTRLYTDPDLARLELILSLTRDLGVNLAGVEIILNMREKMDAMQQEFERFFHYLQSHADELTNFVEPPAEGTTDALVPLTRAAALRRRSASRKLTEPLKVIRPAPRTTPMQHSEVSRISHSELLFRVNGGFQPILTNSGEPNAVLRRHIADSVRQRLAVGLCRKNLVHWNGKGEVMFIGPHTTLLTNSSLATFLLYTDPGSGTLIWQLLLAAFFGGMFYVRRLKDLITQRRRQGRVSRS